MEKAMPKLGLQPKGQSDPYLKATYKEINAEQKDGSNCHVTKEAKSSDSDAHSEDLSSNDEQSNIISSTNSQFYENSDSKIDYAIKNDDNDTLSEIDDIKTDSASADSEDSALGSLPLDCAFTDREDTQERSEGSDSGLDSEAIHNTKLSSFNLSLPCTSSVKNVNISVIEAIKSNKLRSNNNENKVDQGISNAKSVKEPFKSSLKRKRTNNIDETESKKRKESIKFDNVTVYYFPRAQGFSCVPSQGGSTLGMEWEHSHIQKFTLAEHALEQRRLHRQILQQIKSERHNLQGDSLSSSEESDTEEEASDISESELDLDSYFFLQPVPTRQRRALLRAAGVRKIETYEKDECRDIRTSREFCGCACKGTCNPENCLCSLAGIKCQVDRLNFPCGCTRDGCDNTTGRIEFNPVRVRTHFIQTLMRIGIERKNEETHEAAQRQWLEVHSNGIPCCNKTSYEREQCLSHEDGMLRDVSLSPRVDVESCVNTGSFSNVHCNINDCASQSGVADDLSFSYRNNASVHGNINTTNTIHFDVTNNDSNHSDPYTSNILQGKGPPYSTVNTMGFNIINNMQTFQCDLNYPYDQSNDNHHFKGLQSFPATSFEEFAHNSHMSMFSHYGHMYGTDYLQKTSTNVHEHNSLQYQTVQHNQYDMFKSTSGSINNDPKSDAHYNTLMTTPYQTSSKRQIVDNNENWFSHNTLLNLDHSEQVTRDTPGTQVPNSEIPTESNNADTTENFGELIKKTMVESVTV